MALSHGQVIDLINRAILAGAHAHDEQTLFVSMQSHLDVNPFVLKLPAEVIVSGVGVYYILNFPDLNLLRMEQQVQISA